MSVLGLYTDSKTTHSNFELDTSKSLKQLPTKRYLNNQRGGRVGLYRHRTL